MADLKLPGSTEMDFNTATMLLAVNEYIAKHGGPMFDGVSVTAIKTTHESSLSGWADTYKLTIGPVTP